MVVVITVVITAGVELTGVEVINVGTKVVDCSDVVTMVDEVTVVDLVVESDMETKVVVGIVDCVVGSLVVELTNKVAEVVGATVDVVGSKVGDSVAEAMDVCIVVVGDLDIVVEGVVVG